MLANKVTLFGNYLLGSANGDTDSAGGFGFQVISLGFPAYSYDMSGELAPSGFLPRHQMFIGGSFQLPWGVRINPIITASTGRRFNITNGVDTNYDSLFSERPTFGQLAVRCAELGLTNSFCNNNGDANSVIPRNYGKGPGFFSTNLNINKTFGFGGGESRSAGSGGGSGGGNRGGGNRGGGGAGPGGGGGPVMMGGPGGPGGGSAPRPYQLTVGINIQNIFNNVNFNSPTSSLSSPSFGQFRSSTSGFGFFGGGGAANRRVDLRVQFSF